MQNYNGTCTGKCSRQITERKLIPWFILPVRMTHVLHVPGNLQASPLYTVTMNKLRKHSMEKKGGSKLFLLNGGPLTLHLLPFPETASPFYVLHIT
jgi:hypothetical protein